MTHTLFTHQTPWGPVRGAFTERGISRLMTVEEDDATASIASAPPELARALDRYFSGEAEQFEEVPLDLTGASDFHLAVWNAARRVPWGSTSTYGQLAEQVGSAAHARAVGRALGANPLLILIPCHRFIAHDGGLVNFAAGLEWKQRLLQLEGSLML